MDAGLWVTVAGLLLSLLCDGSQVSVFSRLWPCARAPWPCASSDPRGCLRDPVTLISRLHDMAVVRNESHRFLHSSATAKKRIKAREQARRGGGKSDPTDSAD